MTKRIRIILFLFLSLVFFSITILLYMSERHMNEFGLVAVVDPISEYTEETRTAKKLFSETTSKSKLATMTYSQGNNKITFKRYLSEEIFNKFATGERVYIRYIPGEYNTEEFVENKESDLIFPLIAFLISFGLLVVSIRMKKEGLPATELRPQEDIQVPELESIDSKYVRQMGGAKLLLSSGISLLVAPYVFSGGASIRLVMMLFSLPVVFALISLAELITGMPAKHIGRKLNRLNLKPWQENLIWMLVLIIASFILMILMVLFA